MSIEYNLEFSSKGITEIGKKFALTSSIRTYTNRQVVLKRFMDIVSGVFWCLITIILFIFIAPIIYIKSPERIIYSSKRVGLIGNEFSMFKFRSMIPNAEE